MKYSPNENELSLIAKMSDEERFSYCLTRIAEAEEVWGLAESEGWVMAERDEQAVLPIWPYKDFATQCAQKDWKNAEPQAISLEHFVYKVSQQLIKNQIMVEVFPTEIAKGYIMEPQAFFKMLENLMESGEYFMEG